MRSLAAYSDKEEGALCWTALFGVENWNDTVETSYSVDAMDGKTIYEGMIQKNFIEKERECCGGIHRELLERSTALGCGCI